MLRRHFLTYLALSTMAITQPLFDLYAKNTTVFSAAKLSPFEVGLFLAIVSFGPTSFCTLVDWFSTLFGPKVNEATRLVMISGLSVVLGFAVTRWLQIEGSAGSIFLAGGFAIAIPYAFDRWRAVREWSHWLAALSPAVLLSAVVALQPVLIGTNGPASDAIVGNKDVTVLQVIFDEFPLFSLLAPDGSINSVRFPGFAELANNSTWYRNSVAESNFTHQAVPAILSSQVPKQSGGPFLAQYPKNIFTLFGGRTSVEGIEPVTNLCPPSLCKNKLKDSAVSGTHRFVQFLRDATYVLGHRIFPKFIRRHIPSIEGSWGGFGAVANEFKGQFADGALSQVTAIDEAVSNVTKKDSPQIQIVHALLPHAPWRITPDLRIDDLSPTISTMNPDNDEVIRDTYQTFLYQVGAADLVIKNLILNLKESGKWDSTMLVVTADHGISFLPTMPQRHTDFTDSNQVDDIYRIPTFIKYPKQIEGQLDDCAMSNLDLLPTIIDVTQTKTSWKFVGESLAQRCPEGRVRRVVSATGQSDVLTSGFEAARNRASAYAEIVSNVGPLFRVAAVGQSASQIGSAVTEAPLDTRITNWSLTQKAMFTNIASGRGSRVPALVTGEITLASPMDVGTEGIIVVDGIAAGVVGELSGARDVIGFAAVLDYTLFTSGSHTVQLFVRDVDGRLTSAGTPN